MCAAEANVAACGIVVCELCDAAGAADFVQSPFCPRWRATTQGVLFFEPEVVMRGELIEARGIGVTRYR